MGPSLPILNWIRGTDADQIAGIKRLHLTNENAFDDCILSHMDEDGPLQDLAVDIYRVLFLHPGCHGAIRLTNRQFVKITDIEIRNALLAVPVINGKRDPLILRNSLTDVIIRKLLKVVDSHRAAALKALVVAFQE
ncbi:hypothetical protein GGI24_006438 [Coemansia furcata]|nr:hypothetical protein GGI24_006438 [Coemansia furcata]